MKASSEELKVFIAVVESGSFSRAAEQLQMANSAVSRMVKKLESRLGVTLLTRTTRQLALTYEGEHYFRRVQKLMQEMTTAENELIERQQTPQGELRVDAATPVILNLLMPMIKPFRERHPQVRLSLISSENFINLIDRKVDVAIRAGNLTDSTLRARLLFISYRKLVATPAYLATRGTPESVVDLAQHECLGFVEPLRLNRWPISDNGHDLYDIEPGMSANSGETIKMLCLNDQGIACLSDYMVDAEIAKGIFTEVLAEQRIAVEMPFNAVYYSDLGVSQRVRAFIDFLSEWVKDQPWRVQE